MERDRGPGRPCFPFKGPPPPGQPCQLEAFVGRHLEDQFPLRGTRGDTATWEGGHMFSHGTIQNVSLQNLGLSKQKKTLQKRSLCPAWIGRILCPTMSNHPTPGREPREALQKNAVYTVNLKHVRDDKTNTHQEKNGPPPPLPKATQYNPQPPQAKPPGKNETICLVVKSIPLKTNRGKLNKYYADGRI